MSNKNLSDFNFVIFGGDGDLALKKIFPALYQRLNDDQIQDSSKIIVLSNTLAFARFRARARRRRVYT
jgi:glucose-6-phosphate 1-dehydrogenase